MVVIYMSLFRILQCSLVIFHVDLHQIVPIFKTPSLFKSGFPKKNAIPVEISNFNQCQKNNWEKRKLNNNGKDYFIAFIVTSEHFNSAEQWN